MWKFFWLLWLPVLYWAINPEAGVVVFDINLTDIDLSPSKLITGGGNNFPI